MNKYTEAAIAYAEYWRIRLRQALGSSGQSGEGKNILVLRPDMIGDLTCSVPFLRQLRQGFPDCHITLVTSPLAYNMMEICPYVDEVLTYDKKAESHFFMTNLRRSREFAKEHLVGRKWEIAIVLSYANPDTYPEAWMALMSGAKRRIAYSEKVDALKHATYLGAYDLYFTDLLDNQEVSHEVESVMFLAKYLGLDATDTALELWATEDDEEKVAQLLQAEQVDEAKPKIVMCLSTSNDTKDWPLENYVAVARRLLAEQQVELLLLGAGAKDQACAERFMSEVPQAHNLIGRTTLRQTVALLRKADFYLGGDTGPLHMAAACGLKGVAVYKTAHDLDKMHMKGNPAKWFAPWHSKIEVIRPERHLPGCEPDCYTASHCIAQVTAEEVYQALAAQMQEV